MLAAGHCEQKIFFSITTKALCYLKTVNCTIYYFPMKSVNDLRCHCHRVWSAVGRAINVILVCYSCPRISQS